MVMWPLTFDPEIPFCSVIQISDSVFAGLDKGVLHGIALSGCCNLSPLP
jgi:hypothetical protein